MSFENHFPNLELQEILREPYSGRAFPGFEDIDLSFEELEALVLNDRPDWKAALESVKGIYLITEIASEKRYVGSAYGDQGIWSRWCNYIASGHVRIPMKAATDSDGKRPPVPIQNGHFGRGSNWAS